MNNKILLTVALAVLISLSFASAVVVNSVTQDDLYPGQSANLKVSIKNIFSYEVEQVSLILNLDKTLFTSVGSSEDSQDSIRDDDSESFNYELKAPSSIKPGDYNIPYTINYLDDNEDKQIKSGSIGITVKAKTELGYGVELQNNIINTKGKLSFKIVNSGLGDIGFVKVKIVSNNGFEILGSSEDYIGTVSSDDFETASFDVLYKSTSASLTAIVNYKDFENVDQTQTVTLPVKVYTQEKALELGLISKSKTGLYVTVILVLLVVWFIYRKMKKSRKDKLKRQGA